MRLRFLVIAIVPILSSCGKKAEVESPTPQIPYPAVYPKPLVPVNQLVN